MRGFGTLTWKNGIGEGEMTWITKWERGLHTFGPRRVKAFLGQICWILEEKVRNETNLIATLIITHQF